MAAELRIAGPDIEPRVARLAADSVWIGRSPTCEVSYPEDAGLSRRHFQLEKREGEWFVIDGGSLNGTELNGVLLAEPTALKAGDKITAGHLEIELVVVSEVEDPWEGIAAFAAEASPTAPPAIAPVEAEPWKGMAGFAAETISPGCDTAPVGDVSYYEAPGPPAQIVTLSLDTDAIAADPASFALDLCLEVLHCERGALVLKTAGDFQVKAKRGGPFRIDRGLRGRVIRGESLSVVTAEGSFAMVPLHAIPGFLYVECTRVLTEIDLNLLSAVSDAASQRLRSA